MGVMVEVSALKKRYGSVRAVNGIDFTIREGEFFAFLGPNGAGKSTTIEILSTLLGFDEGLVEINGFKLGKDDNRIRESIGIVFQYSVLDRFLTVRENLELRASFYGLKGSNRRRAIMDAAEISGICKILEKPYGTLSGGQRRRADIARALINTPRILFLDEPTTGLDPQTRLSVWEAIRRLQEEEQVTIFLSTHYMHEASRADNIAIIDEGLITAMGSPGELKNRYSKDRLFLFPKDRELLIQVLRENSIMFSNEAERIIVELSTSLDALPILKETEQFLKSFEVVTGDMDDVFVNITGRVMREDRAE